MPNIYSIYNIMPNIYNIYNIAPESAGHQINNNQRRCLAFGEDPEPVVVSADEFDVDYNKVHESCQRVSLSITNFPCQEFHGCLSVAAMSRSIG